MPVAPPVCPHCGSRHNRLLTDHQGWVGWCGDCHRAWILERREPMAAKTPSRLAERQRRRA